MSDARCASMCWLSKNRVLVPGAIWALPCASWSNSLLKEFVHTSRCFSLLIKCRYSNAPPGVVVYDGVCHLDVVALGLCGHAFLPIFELTAIE